MISRQQNKSARKNILKKTAFVALFVLTLVLLNTTERNPLTGASYAIATPFWKAQTVIQNRVGSFLSLLKSKKSLIEENNALKNSLQEIEYFTISFEAAKKENSELKRLLGRVEGRDTILAAVLSRPRTSPYDTLVIDIGSTDNIHVGDLVIAFGDYVVGFISKVYTHNAQVTLFSAPGIKTNVLIGEENRVASAEGRGGGNFIAELPRDVNISEGDVVILADITTQIFSVVESISHTSVDAFQVIRFKNPVNLFTLTWVQVVRTENGI